MFAGLVVLLAATGCGGPDPDLCQLAVAHLEECVPGLRTVASATCDLQDQAYANDLLQKSCQDLQTLTRNPGKGDWGLCFHFWDCTDDPGPRGTRAPQVLYLNFEGVTLTPGSSNNAPSNTTYDVDLPTTFPPFDSDHFDLQFPQSRQEAIDTITDKVRRYFASFNVRVVTERPAASPYTMVVVGGTTDLVNFDGGDGMFGLAPLDCGNTNPSDVVFVFTDEPWTKSLAFPKTAIAASIAHEAGHSFGLNHIDRSDAIMSPTGRDLLGPILSWRRGQTVGSSSCVAGSAEQDSRQLLHENLD